MKKAQTSKQTKLLDEMYVFSNTKVETQQLIFKNKKESFWQILISLKKVRMLLKILILEVASTLL